MKTEIEVSKYNEKLDDKVNYKNKITVLFYRWIFLVCISILVFPTMNVKKDGFALIETMVIAAMYNAAITIFVLRNKEKISKSSSTLVYFDILIITIISFMSGGINSDLYMFILFLLGYCGLFNDGAYTLKVGAFSVIFYTASCLFAANMNSTDLELSKLIVRDAIFILGAYGISRVNHEVKRFDELRKKEFKLARTDKLTGLANRHYFDQKLNEETQYADMNNATLNVLMFDLDNFKNFNDTYGHLSGDKLLTLFSDIIKQCIRKSDIPVRYGGEEFLILIRDLDIFLAKSVGERIRRQLEKQRIYIGNGDSKKKVSVSCGLAQYPLHSRSIKQVVEMADQALYYAKEIGKNIVITYDEIGQERIAEE
jgi:diguanylate cyclase (GGDEF) domain